MEHEYTEYITFQIKTKDGAEVEMAVVDEFDYDKKHYIVGALIKDDTIQDEGRYIYRSVIKEDSFTVEKITREFEYQKVVEAYMDMLDEEEEDEEDGE